MAGELTVPRIGVLALQGDFREHYQVLTSLGALVTEVRLPGDLLGLNGLIIPGGESTTIAGLITDYQLWQPIRDFHKSGAALWGTCAGAILLAQEISGAQEKSQSLGLMDITVCRNAFGRQVDSFETELDIEGLEKPFKAVFIRAPIIERVGKDVQVLARYADHVVFAQQGNLLASSFHPELTNDSRLHELFLGVAKPS